MSNPCDWLIENVRIATFASDSVGYGEIENATVAIHQGKIKQVSTQRKTAFSATNRLDAKGKWLTPGLIDCHTHLVFGGNRAREFEWRLQGESYQAIAQRGGGIMSSVKATRALTELELLDQSAPRLERLIEEGVTTVEIKSGYGLNTETELMMLRVARQLGKRYPVDVQTTFLGAHALAPEFQTLVDGKQAYIDFVCQKMLPEVAESGLADAVDVFCEGIGFNLDQCSQVFETAASLGLPVKAHVEQLSNLQGAVNAAQHGALSVDHIEYLAEQDVAALAGTVAVLLPAAFYCLNETQKPPIAALRDLGIPMAVASDLNPGTAPIASLLTVLNQACVLFGLTPAEALAGATANAAQALGLEAKGRVEQGYDADLVLWDIEHPAELVYGVNFHRPLCVWQAGRLRTNRAGTA